MSEQVTNVMPQPDIFSGQGDIGGRGISHAYSPAAAREFAEALGAAWLRQADVERACEVMHDAYEAAASGNGWETQQASRKPWADVPEANKATMRAAVSALVGHLANHLDGRTA